jgi:hypothetical protein
VPAQDIVAACADRTDRLYHETSNCLQKNGALDGALFAETSGELFPGQEIS